MSCIEKKIDSEEKYRGVIVNVRLDHAELCDGSVVKREVVEHPGGATILPIDDEGYCYCVRQFRYPFQKELLEAAAGKLEYGEDPYECAVRELSEETGFTADEIISLGQDYSSPGFSTETLHIYLARGLHRGKSHLDEGEFLSVEKHHIDELVQLVMDGKIADGKTIIAVLKAKRLLENEK